MKRWLHALCLIAGFATFAACRTQGLAGPISGNPGLIPAPARCQMYEGSFALTSRTKISLGRNVSPATGRFLRAGIEQRTGLGVEIVAPRLLPGSGAIRLRLDPRAAIHPEGYRLAITPRAVTLNASTDAGLFYGVQSLLQMLDARSSGPRAATPASLPAVVVEDAPRFAWRGLMLDESRHFFGKDVVKQTLDMMAYLKMNRFHWHLTDSPGWRIEIEKYPRLTEVGSIGNHSDPAAPPAFYTQDQIRDIVRYAADRHIMIVPEIDMPGHANAATRAYPALSGGNSRRFGHFTFNPAREETYAFLDDVLTEVAALFPAPYIHLGGDEVSFGSQPWLTDPVIQQFAGEHGYESLVEIEHYFVKRMADFINKKLEKKVMGWDEITSSGVAAQDSVLFWWRQNMPNSLKTGLRNGYDFVLCPRAPCYFDFIQAPGDKAGRTTLVNTLRRVYEFPDNDLAALIAPGQEKQILGLQACVWTEEISTPRRLQYMAYPRLAALAEDGWTERSNKNFDGFLERLRPFLKLLDERNIYYFDPFDPARTPEPPAPVKVPNPNGV